MRRAEFDAFIRDNYSLLVRYGLSACSSTDQVSRVQDAVQEATSTLHQVEDLTSAFRPSTGLGRHRTSGDLMTQETTATTVAQWMEDQVAEHDVLYRQEAVETIYEKFGEKFAPDNDAGNLSIAKDVLAAFKSMTAEKNVWSQGEKCWRRREPDDEPGKWKQD